jgi:hypothetical protein
VAVISFHACFLLMKITPLQCEEGFLQGEKMVGSPILWCTGQIKTNNLQELNLHSP